MRLFFVFVFVSWMGAGCSSDEQAQSAGGQPQPAGFSCGQGAGLSVLGVEKSIDQVLRQNLFGKVYRLVDMKILERVQLPFEGTRLSAVGSMQVARGADFTRPKPEVQMDCLDAQGLKENAFYPFEAEIPYAVRADDGAFVNDLGALLSFEVYDNASGKEPVGKFKLTDQGASPHWEKLEIWMTFQKRNGDVSISLFQEGDRMTLLWTRSINDDLRSIRAIYELF